jgi:hypothetical protein
VPLLEQLDWFFTSSNWVSDYPNSLVLPLARTSSDHVPSVVNIDTNIPKARIFRFDYYWVDLPGFRECVFFLPGENPLLRSIVQLCSQIN